MISHDVHTDNQKTTKLLAQLIDTEAGSSPLEKGTALQLLT